MNKFAYILLLFSLVFAPLAFGTSEQWSLSILQGTSFLALCILSLHFLLKKRRFLYIPGLIPLLLLNIFIALQLIPLPPTLVAIISPGTLDVYQPVGMFGDKWIPITINQKATLLELFRVMGCTAIYIVTIQLLHKPQKLKDTIQIIVFFAGILSFFAILQQFSAGDNVYWFRKAPVTPFGPWVNRNQFSGFAELVFPLGLAFFLFLSSPTWNA